MAIANITNNILTDSGIATSSLLPYTGATTNVDLGTNSISSSFIYGNGVSGLAGSIYLKQTTSIQDSSSGYSSMSAFGASSLHFSLNNGTLNRRFRINSVNLDGTNIRTYLLPDADGTIALTSDLSAYITLATTQTISGLKTFDAAISANYGIALLNGAIPPLTSIYYAALSGNSTGISITYRTGGGTNYTNNLNFPDLNNSYLFPSASGTLALTSDLGAYLPLTGGTLTGALSGTTATFSGLGTFYQLTMTGATAGRIFYAQTGGVVSQSGNLNWNETNGMLGVGTPNPSAVITAFSNNAATQFKAAGTAPAFTFSQSLTTSTYACVFGLATSANHFITGTAAGDMAIANQSTTAGAIVFGTGTAEKMRMSPSGRLLVGTSVDSGALFQVAGAATFSSSVTATQFNASSKYAWGTATNGTTGQIATDNTNNYFDYLGNLYFRGAAASNNLITFLSSGNVGIGTSSPDNLLHLAATQGTLKIASNSTSGANIPSLTFFHAGNDEFKIVGGGYLSFLSSGTTERMRITSGGNVGIGTSSPQQILSVNNPFATNGVLYPIIISQHSSVEVAGMYSVADAVTNPIGAGLAWKVYKQNVGLIEAMRITSGGVLLFGTTANTTGRLGSINIQSNGEFYSKGSFGGYFWEDRTNSANWGGLYMTSNTYFYFNGSANIASISSSTGVYTPLSDVNKKKDFEVSEIGLNEILNLKPTLYRMKTDNEDAEKQLGFIAQEVKEFIPQAFVESGEDENKFIGLNYNAITAGNTKAIQELYQLVLAQDAKIEELKSLINK